MKVFLAIVLLAAAVAADEERCELVVHRIIIIFCIEISLSSL